MTAGKCRDILLDTHTFLWWVEGELPASTIKVIQEAKNAYLSVASCWEMAIKVSRGKLKLAKSVEAYVSEHTALNDFKILDVKLSHVARVEKLPFHHSDPFDRLIIAQAIELGIPVVTVDGEFTKYKSLQVVW